MAKDCSVLSNSERHFAGCSLVSSIVEILTEGTSEERIVDLPAITDYDADAADADELYNRRVAAYAEFTKTILSEIIAMNISAAVTSIPAPAAQDDVPLTSAISPSPFSTLHTLTPTATNKAAAHAAFQTHVHAYLSGWTGDARAPENMGYNDLMARIAAQTDLFLVDEAQLESLSAMIGYRIAQRTFATSLLQHADIPLPFGLTCTQWTTGASQINAMPYPRPPQLSEESLASTFGRLGKANLMDGPARGGGQGLRWTDPPLRYLVAALCLAKYGDGEKARKIKVMKDAKRERTEALAGKMRENPTVREAAARLVDAVGGSLRDLSPS